MRLLRLLLLLLVVVALAGCSSAAAPAPTQENGPKRGGVLTILMNPAGDPPSYDLHRESVGAAIESAGPAYENLIRFDPLAPSDIVPDLAERWEAAPDGLAYTFHLRQGVRFHSGGAFTAGDAVFSLQRVQSPPPGMVSPRKATLDAVAAVEAVDPSTVRVRLSRPSPSLLANLAVGWMALYERAWVQAGGPDRPMTEMNGTGPFKLKLHQRGSSLELERNPSYREPGLPYLDGVKLLVAPDFSTRTAAVRTGQAHFTRVFPTDAADLQKALGDKVTVLNQVAQSFGALTLNARRPPLDNPLVRQAINLAIDRRANIQLLAQGAGSMGGYMTPGGPWALSADELAKLPGYGADKTADQDRARQLLAQAGYPAGFTTVIATRSGQTFEQTAVVVADQLRKIGITATVKTYDIASAFDVAQRGDFDLLTWGHEFALDDPDAVYGEFYGCGAPRNYFGACVPEVDALVERQSREIDPAKRRVLVQDLERTAVTAGIKLIPHWVNRVDVWWSYVRNYLPHPAPFNNARYREVWLDR